MGNSFAHIELNTDDVAKAKKFYGKLFDWKITDMPGMDYTMISFGSRNSGGGIQKKQMADAPTQWVPYVSVDSVKKTMAKAAKAGAQIIAPYVEIGDMGAIGIFVDPTGATLGVWEAAKKPAKKAAKKVAKKVAKKR